MIATLTYRVATASGMQELADELGMNDTEIGQQLGVSYQTVYRMRRYGADRRSQLALLGWLVESGREELRRKYFKDGQLGLF